MSIGVRLRLLLDEVNRLCCPSAAGQADPRLTSYLAASTAEQTLEAWVGGEDLRAVCFLDEFTSARDALDYYASVQRVPANLPLSGADGNVPEGALGVLTIRGGNAEFALVSQRYLFEPSVCYGPNAVLHRSDEDGSHWEVDGDRLPSR